MAYSIEIKNDVISRIARGEKVKNISEKMGISVPTIYKWKKEIKLDNQNMDNMNLAEQKETSKEIKRLIKLRKFDEALEYTDKYPFNPIIQSQKIKIYIEKRDYEKAKEIGKIFKDNEPIQSQMVTIAIKEGNYEKAKEIGERFKYYAPIQSQMVTIAIKEGDYEKAKEIGEIFEDNKLIQSQMITIAIKEGDYETAKEIGERFKGDSTIQKQMKKILFKEDAGLIEQKETSKEIKGLIKLRKFDEALEYTDKYPFNPIIQSQKIKIYIEKKDYEKAKEIGERFKYYAPIQSQMVTIAIKEGDYETAKEIGKRFKYDEIIQSQMITIAIKEGDYETTEEVEIIEQLKDYNPFNRKTEDHEIKNIELLNEIKTKMYYEVEKIDAQEILQNKQLTEKQKLYIVLAIYEKSRNTKGIKELVKQYKDCNESKNINIILQRAQSKKKQIFDWEIYDNCLGWILDEQLKNEYEQKIKEQESNKKKKIEEEKQKQKIKEEEKQRERKIKNNTKKQIIEGKINSLKKENTNKVNLQNTQMQHRENNSFKQEIKVHVQQELTKINQQNEGKQQIHIYNEVMEYLLEKRKPIYVKMQSTDLETQREGISQWDKLDDLIEKIKELKENEDYMKSIYERVTRLKEKEENLIEK